jgi:hypothetical protein
MAPFSKQDSMDFYFDGWYMRGNNEEDFELHLQNAEFIPMLEEDFLNIIKESSTSKYCVSLILIFVVIYIFVLLLSFLF